jgi:hypothetical protein
LATPRDLPREPSRESTPNDEPPRELFIEEPIMAGDGLFNGAKEPSDPNGISPFNGDRPRPFK